MHRIISDISKLPFIIELSSEELHQSNFEIIIPDYPRIVIRFTVSEMYEEEKYHIWLNPYPDHIKWQDYFIEFEAPDCQILKYNKLFYETHSIRIAEDNIYQSHDTIKNVVNLCELKIDKCQTNNMVIKISVESECSETEWIYCEYRKNVVKSHKYIIEKPNREDLLCILNDTSGC